MFFEEGIFADAILSILFLFVIGFLVVMNERKYSLFLFLPLEGIPGFGYNFFLKKST